MTIFHLRDLASGRRRIIRCEDVKVFQAPMYDGLAIKNMLTFAKNYPEVVETLPLEEREIDKLPRDYISCICYTLIGQPFLDWVDVQVNARNQKIQQQHNMMVDLDP